MFWNFKPPDVYHGGKVCCGVAWPENYQLTNLFIGTEISRTLNVHNFLETNPTYFRDLRSCIPAVHVPLPSCENVAPVRTGSYIELRGRNDKSENRRSFDAMLNADVNKYRCCCLVFDPFGN